MSTSNQQTPAAKTHQKTQRRQLDLEILALVVVTLAFLLPRLLSLRAFVTPDEHLWLSRSANFYMALAQRDFASTYMKATPGVTIMWAGTASFLTLFPEYRGSALGQVDDTIVHNYIIKNAKGVTTPIDLLYGARIFIVLGNTFIVILAYLYSRRLIGLLPALIGFLLLAFDPFHLALSRLLHTDGALSNFLFISLLAFISFIKDRKTLDLVLSGGTAGLSWLTKSPGVILIPVVGFLALIQMWRIYSSKKGQSPNTIKHIRDHIWPLIAWGMIGLLVFVILWPAMWVNPIQSILSIFGSAQRLAEEGHYAGTFFYGAASNRMSPAYFYPLTFLWRTTPIVILGLLSTAWGLLSKRRPFEQEGVRLTLIGLLLLVVIFTIGMSTGLKKLDRYLLPAYAPLDIIAGMGWATLIFWIKGQNVPIVSRYGAYFILALVIGIQMFLSLSKFPYYFSYYNPLMGGSKRAPDAMQVGWGEGLDQAAKYLNEKPNAKGLHVMSWYPSGSFSYYFVGHTENMRSPYEVSDSMWDKFLSSDYAVIYVNQWQRDLHKKILDYLERTEPEKRIWIDGIEYVRIYKLN